MKQLLFNKKVIFIGLITIAVIALLAACDCTGEGIFAAATIIPGVAGGKHVVDGPVTTVDADTASPGLLRSELDERIVKIRPMSTPIDQISRYGGNRHSGSMKVEYYAVDTKEVKTEVNRGTSVSGSGDDDTTMVSLRLNDLSIIEATDTLLFPQIKLDGGECLVGYVTSKSSDNVQIALVNLPSGKSVEITTGTPVVRMGRAAGELDVQTSQYEALPVKQFNYCQIFKSQVEQSTLMRLANKEVGWTLSDQEEAAIVDMRLGMEKNFLFGSRGRVYDDEKREYIHLTGGIWNQTGRTATYTVGELNHAKLVEISRMAFTQNAGSSRKILIGGTGLIEQLHNMEHYKVVEQGSSMTRWGLDFTEIRTKFGCFYVIASEVFDQCGHANDGMIIDPEYITKYSHIPFRTERLDLRSSGVRNTDAVIITEASCVILRYPTAHMRIIAQ